MPAKTNLGLVARVLGVYLPGISVAVHLGSDGVHDVLLALDALLPPLYLLYILLSLVLTQLPIPLPEGSAVRPHLWPDTHVMQQCPWWPSWNELVMSPVTHSFMHAGWGLTDETSCLSSQEWFAVICMHCTSFPQACSVTAKQNSQRCSGTVDQEMHHVVCW